MESQAYAISIVHIRDVVYGARVLSTTLTAHSSFMNSTWALCIQSQTATAMKRNRVYSS
ncbi:MAG: hypothetical protein QXL96_10060 [Ignisphaera sp.]